MAAESKQTHPVLQYLKDNAVVIGLVVIVAASVAYFAFSQNATAAEPASQTAPRSLPAAELDPNAVTDASAAPEGSPGATAPAPGSAGAQGATQPAPAPTPTERVVLGTEPQSVSAKDWRPYAKDFASAWVNTADGKEAWLDRLEPLVSADLYAGFVQTDVSTVPAVAIDSVSLAEESLGAKTFRAYSGNGAVFEGRVSVQADGSWLVDQIAPPKK